MLRWASRVDRVLIPALGIFVLAVAQFNNPPGVDIWCGKAYHPSNSSFDPGGWFDKPPKSSEPLLSFRVRPRMSIYLDTESEASLLIDAAISEQVGFPLPFNYSAILSTSSEALDVEIVLGDHVIGRVPVRIGSTGVEVVVDLDRFTIGFDGSNVTARATLAGVVVYKATTQLFRLPTPEAYGSVSRIDNLYGGLWVMRGDESWRRIFPYTYYVQWGLYWDANVTTLDEFSSLGYNVIHIVPTGSLGEQPFPWDHFDSYLKRADELGLFLQYDVIWDYQNLSGMVEQVERIRSHRSLLLWYQSDEPDGKGNPVNSTMIAHEKILQLDPYHPSSLALNCYDFFYEEYAKGGEIIIADVYPISTNTSYSTVYATVCNSTYGCCGCDGCKGTFEDISDRLDEFYRRDELIGWTKTQWFAPQAFGNETFWTRYPTPAEEVVMTLLAINHGAKGIVMWDFPTSVDISNTTGRLASVLTDDHTADFLLGAPRTQTLRTVMGNGVDTTIWIDAEARQALLIIVNTEYGNAETTTEVIAPDEVTFTLDVEIIWGDLSWRVENGKMLVSSTGMLGLQASIIIIGIS